MRTTLGGLTLSVALLLFSASARAQNAPSSGPQLPTPPASKDQPPATVTKDEDAATPAQAEPLAGVVRGLYVEARVGGGYTLVADELTAEQVGDTFPGLVGEKEGLGAGSTVHVAVGYDVTPAFALQGLAGLLLVSGTRSERVRDLGVTYGGVGGRLAIDVSERLDFLVSAGAGFARASNGVESATSGAMVLGGVGLEYYVHIRHFSVGLDLSVFAPMSPMRVFAALSPTLKYTF